jgi:predicted nucleotidyltransferase
VSDVPERPLDLRELFRVLAEQGVDYLVIGGVAAQVHGRRRTTKDLDVTPAPDPENFERLAAALVTLEARPVEVDLGASIPIPTAEQLRLAPIVPPLSTRHGELHILNEVPGSSVYAEMRARALTIDLDGIAIQIIGLDDLIRMKQTLGRPSDIEDVQALATVARREARSAAPAKHGIGTNASELPGSDK